MRLVKLIQAQPRLATAVLAGVLLWFVLPGREGKRFLEAWDCATGLYLALALIMMARSDVESIRVRAALHDEGQMVILGLTTSTAIVSLAGIIFELSTAKTLRGHGGWQHVLMAVLTLFLSWSFLHTMFAVHYAHEYYVGREGGLEFPGDEPPDYWDFMYYSFIIGSACATADVNITSKTMRRTTTLHCIISFAFNATILALTVNIGAGLF